MGVGPEHVARRLMGWDSKQQDTFLGKSAYEISMTDLLAVFEVLTDTEKLADFEDSYGLIIGGIRCGI